MHAFGKTACYLTLLPNYLDEVFWRERVREFGLFGSWSQIRGWPWLASRDSGGRYSVNPLSTRFFCVARDISE